MIPGIIVSYAQNFEDVLLWRALLDIKEGFYIDVGAQDPVIDSVSLGFYEHGWRGIHVEPSAHFAALLRQGRPDELVIQAAVSDTPGLLSFFEVPDTGMSTAVPELASYAVSRGRTIQQTIVPAVTLDDIFTLADGKEVHWLKIDVEGMECAVLKGWSQADVRPWIVLLESITPWREHDHNKWEPLLLGKGYEFVYFDGLNRYYVLDSRPDLKAQFGYGPSLWDPFHVPESSRLLDVKSQQNRDRVASLSVDLQAATAHGAHLQTALDSSQVELAAVREEAARLRLEAEELRTALAASQDASSAFQNSLAELEATLTRSRTDLDLTRAGLELSRMELDSSRAALAEAVAENVEMRSRYDDLEVRAREWSSGLDALRSELDTTRGRLTEMEAQRKAAESAFLSSSAELEQREADVRSLQRGYHSLQTEFRTLDERAARDASELAAKQVEAAAVRARYDQIQHFAGRLAAETSLLRRKLSQVHSLVEGACSAVAASHDGRSNAASKASDEAVPADSLDDLLNYHDEAFVRKAYFTLLNRSPDPSGLEHFVQKLRTGVNRLSILEEMQASEEGKRVKAVLGGLQQALLNRTREGTLRARLGRLIHRRTSAEAELEAVARRVGDQVPRLAAAHSDLAVRFGQLDQAMRQITGILESPFDPVLAAPVRIIRVSADTVPADSVRADSVRADSVPADAPHAELFEREIGGAFLQMAAAGTCGQGAQITAVLGPPDAALDPALRPAIHIGEDCDETGYPGARIDGLNAHYVAAACTSKHARKILIDQGAETPVVAIGAGVDHWDRIIPAQLPELDAKSFRFVHISRQPLLAGADIALRSFANAFRSTDDVSLVVACTPEAQAAIEEQISQIERTHESIPHVILCVRAWIDAELKALFSQCEVLVAPARAAGFYHTAFAICSGLDVVATAAGGHLDYCSGENAWLVDFDFEVSDSPRSQGAIWTRVKESALQGALRAAYASSFKARAARVQLGRERLRERFTWNAVASRFLQFSESAAVMASAPRRRVGWVTTWNTRCGIAAASSHMVSALPPEDVVIFAAVDAGQLGPDGENCRRIWYADKQKNDLMQIAAELDLWSIGALMIQFNYGFFNHDELQEFLEIVTDRGVAVMIDLHSTVDPKGEDRNFRLDTFLPGLRKCHRIFAHSAADMNRLKALGLVDNVVLFPLGVINRGQAPARRDLSGTTPLLASFGFFLPNKGLSELVEAVAALRDQGHIVRLLMLNAEHPDPVSRAEINRIRTRIAELNLGSQIEVRTEFLEEDVCMQLLTQADLLVNPYQSTGEAASAAVRLSLATGRPVAVTPIPIFNDLGGAVFRMPGTRPPELAEGIVEVLNHLKSDSPQYRAVRHAAGQWLEAHNFQRQARRLMSIVRAFECEAVAAPGPERN